MRPAPWLRSSSVRPRFFVAALTVAACAAAGCSAASPEDEARVLLETAATEAGPARDEATEAALVLAERQAANGDRATAGHIYRTLREAGAGPDRRHVRCAAIRGLAWVGGTDAIDDLIAAMAGDEPQVRAAAIQGAAEGRAEGVTRAWAERLATAPPAVRPAIVRILASRGGPAATEAILGAMDDADPPVRLAAIRGAADLGTLRAVDPLLRLLAFEDEATREAARDALARLPALGASEAIAERLPGLAPAAKQEAVNVLVLRAARGQAGALAACLRDDTAGVQVAACRALAILGGAGHAAPLIATLCKPADEAAGRAAEGALAAIGERTDADRFTAAVLAAMDGSRIPARAALVRLLGAAPTEAGLAAAREAVRSEAPEVRLAAVRVLADWPGTAAADDLLAVARGAGEAKHRILAVRGYVRLAGRVDAAKQRVAMYGRALAAAERVAEKRLALAGLAEVASPAALDLAMQWTGDAALAREASAAVVGIAAGLAPSRPAEARAALEAVLANLDDGKLRTRAERVLERLRAEHRGR